jgi:aspartate-semialdehyde dehydrogenase
VTGEKTFYEGIMMKLWNIALVGATGLAGEQVRELLEERNFPVGVIRFLAAGKGVGAILEYGGQPVPVMELTPDSFAGIDIAFFCAGSSRSREFCPSAVLAGAVCIDTSSAWRMDPEVPLVVPEVNPVTIGEYSRKGIIATPASSVIQLVIALKPLHDTVGIRRIVVSTYQAVSGTGRKAISELQKQVGELLNGRPIACGVYPHQIAFNCLPQIDAFEPDGSTSEELKIINETRKIMGADIKVTATAVRVPVFYGHSESINIETDATLTAAKARELLVVAPGVELVDDPAAGGYPMAIDAAGQDLVMVGRIRDDASLENGLNLWVVADNLRQEAANAIRIAEILVESYLNHNSCP